MIRNHSPHPWRGPSTPSSSSSAKSSASIVFSEASPPSSTASSPSPRFSAGGWGVASPDPKDEPVEEVYDLGSLHSKLINKSSRPIFIPRTSIPSPFATYLSPNAVVGLYEYLTGEVKKDHRPDNRDLDGYHEKFGGSGNAYLDPGDGSDAIPMVGTGPLARGNGRSIWAAWKRAYDLWNGFYIEDRIDPQWFGRYLLQIEKEMTWKRSRFGSHTDQSDEVQDNATLEIEGAFPPLKDKSNFWKPETLPEYEDEFIDDLNNNVWMPRSVGETLPEIKMDDSDIQEEYFGDGGRDCTVYPYKMMSYVVKYAYTQHDNPDSKVRVKVWDGVAARIFNVQSAPLGDRPNLDYDKHSTLIGATYRASQDIHYAVSTPQNFPLDIRRVNKVKDVDAMDVEPPISFLIEGQLGGPKPGESTPWHLDTDFVNDAESPWYMAPEQRQQLEQCNRANPESMDVEDYARWETDDRDFPMSHIHDDSLWMHELKRDEDNSARYFVSNCDGRTLIVNGQEILDGEFAGPLPDFAVIECPGGNIVFWWGNDGRDYGGSPVSDLYRSFEPQWRVVRRDYPELKYVARKDSHVWRELIDQKLKRVDEHNDVLDTEWEEWREIARQEEVEQETEEVDDTEDVEDTEVLELDGTAVDAATHGNPDHLPELMDYVMSSAPTAINPKPEAIDKWVPNPHLIPKRPTTSKQVRFDKIPTIYSQENVKRSRTPIAVRRARMEQEVEQMKKSLSPKEIEILQEQINKLSPLVPKLTQEPGRSSGNAFMGMAQAKRPLNSDDEDDNDPITKKPRSAATKPPVYDPLAFLRGLGRGKKSAVPTPRTPSKTTSTVLPTPPSTGPPKATPSKPPPQTPLPSNSTPSHPKTRSSISGAGISAAPPVTPKRQPVPSVFGPQTPATPDPQPPVNSALPIRQTRTTLGVKTFRLPPKKGNVGIKPNQGSTSQTPVPGPKGAPSMPTVPQMTPNDSQASDDSGLQEAINVSLVDYMMKQVTIWAAEAKAKNHDWKAWRNFKSMAAGYDSWEDLAATVFKHYTVEQGKKVYVTASLTVDDIKYFEAALERADNPRITYNLDGLPCADF